MAPFALPRAEPGSGSRVLLASAFRVADVAMGGHCTSGGATNNVAINMNYYSMAQFTISIIPFHASRPTPYMGALTLIS